MGSGSSVVVGVTVLENNNLPRYLTGRTLAFGG